MPDAAYELLVIGSGPAGHHAAIQAAKLHRRALLVERKSVVGGTCINIGTIPSKTMREAVIYLSGYREHSIYGQSYKVKDKITLQDLLFRVDAVVRHEIDVSRHQLTRNGIEVVNAEASFQDPHTLRLRQPGGHGESIVTADHVVLAVGTEAIPDPRIPLRRQFNPVQRRCPGTGASSAQPGCDRWRSYRLRVCQHVRGAGRARDAD